MCVLSRWCLSWVTSNHEWSEDRSPGRAWSSIAFSEVSPFRLSSPGWKHWRRCRWTYRQGRHPRTALCRLCPRHRYHYEPRQVQEAGGGSDGARPNDQGPTGIERCETFSYIFLRATASEPFLAINRVNPLTKKSVCQLRIHRYMDFHHVSHLSALVPHLILNPVLEQVTKEAYGSADISDPLLRHWVGRCPLALRRHFLFLATAIGLIHKPQDADPREI